MYMRTGYGVSQQMSSGIRAVYGLGECGADRCRNWRGTSKGCVGKHVHQFLQKALTDTSTERPWLGQAHMQVPRRKQARELRHANDGLSMHQARATFFLV